MESGKKSHQTPFCHTGFCSAIDYPVGNLGQTTSLRTNWRALTPNCNERSFNKIEGTEW